MSDPNYDDEREAIEHEEACIKYSEDIWDNNDEY